MQNSNDLIFISIAAYRDLQLVPTIQDCLKKAARPDRLRFGICWQHGSEEASLPFRDDARFRILDVHWRESQGACWARAAIMKLWQGEDWFFQVDSHCRFAVHWDQKLLDAVEQTESPKPVIGTYATPFTPGIRETLGNDPMQMALLGFTEEGIPHMKPLPISNWRRLHRPIRARFLSAGFFFTRGVFVQEVGYDPELYFLGEEAAMTLRAYTHGYDLFHPVETIVWHDYIRANATKHWDDHTSAAETQQNWSELDRHSKAKVQKLLTGRHVESYGLGSTRSIEQYEKYAGLSFAKRKAQDYTMRCEQPPNPEALPGWTEQIYTWMAKITVDRASIPSQALTDPSFWYVGIRDESRNEMYRKDLSPADLQVFSGTEPNLVIVCEFQAGTIPASWSVWPVTRSGVWLTKLEGVFEEEDFTIVTEDEQQ